jgi:hypothetical protein
VAKGFELTQADVQDLVWENWCLKREMTALAAKNEELQNLLDQTKPQTEEQH